MSARSPARLLLALALLAAARPAAAANPGTYTVGNIPVTGAVGALEFPVARGFAATLMLGALGQGTYDERNPFTYLALTTPVGWIHYDGVQNLRLSAGFQEVLYGEVPSMGVKSSHEERGVIRARIQQPRGAAALYELVQLDVRSFDDPTGTHRLIYRPRVRVGQGFNLDAVRIHSLVLYQELGLRYGEPDYVKSSFDFFRAYAGYMWTTRRGVFVSLGLIGQVQLNAPATRYDVLWGPVLAFEYRIRAAAPPEAPPPPPDVDVQ